MLTYRLKELMDSKYGLAKYAIGCEIVAMWLNHKNTIQRWTHFDVNRLCTETTLDAWQHPIYAQEAEQLRRLFGLKSINELYTIPEQSLSIKTSPFEKI